jgi:hypothetical protein
VWLQFDFSPYARGEPLLELFERTVDLRRLSQPAPTAGS